MSELTNADDVELEATLQELLLDLRGDAVETDMAPGKDSIRVCRRHCDVQGARAGRCELINFESLYEEDVDGVDVG